MCGSVVRRMPECKRLRTGGPNAATLVFTRDRTDRWVVYAGRTDAAGQGLDAGGTPDGATT